MALPNGNLELITSLSFDNKPCARLSQSDKTMMTISEVEVKDLASQMNIPVSEIESEIEAVAASTCQGCPHLMSCRILGLLYTETGVWGGLTRKGRRAWYRKLFKPNNFVETKRYLDHVQHHGSRQQVVAFRNGARLRHPELDSFVFAK